MLLAARPAGAEDAFKWALTVSAGRYTDQYLYEDVLRQHALVFENTWLMNVALAHPFSVGARHQWELEGQVDKYAGQQQHWELNGLILWRWTDFPWNRWLRTTAAIGDGVSYATVVPPLELASNTNTGSQRVLNYFLIETTFAPPQARNWALVVRVHHRSGILGLYGGVHGGSNVISVGTKFLF
jgi:hypothetical protein